MAFRTLGDMIANVQRSLAFADVPLGDIQKALETANKKIHGSYEWPWTYKDANIKVYGATSTGGVYWTVGDTKVYGVHTNAVTTDILATPWSSTNVGWRIRFGTSLVDYGISAYTAETSGPDVAEYFTLAETPLMASNLTYGSYLLFQDEYDMPSDWEPGSDIFLGNPTTRMHVKHIPRIHYEQQGISIRPMISNLTMYYADAGFNSTTHCYRIKFLPIISTDAEYRMTYRAKPPDLSSAAIHSGIPEGFDEVVEFHAEEELRRVYQLPGLMECRGKASGTLKMLRKKISVGLVDNQPQGTGMGRSSISQWGLSILPWGS